MDDDSTLLEQVFEEKGVFGMTGNYAFTRLVEYPKWEAGQYGPPAFTGRFVTGKDGYFCGWMMNHNLTRSLGHSDGEAPIVGRFFRGRNDSVHMIFCTLRDFVCKLWIKKKINQFNQGIFTLGSFSDQPWDEYIKDGYCDIDVESIYVCNDDDQAALAKNIQQEFDRLVKTGKNFKEKVVEFSDSFDFIRESMLDLLDEEETTVIPNIAFPES